MPLQGTSFVTEVVQGLDRLCKTQRISRHFATARAHRQSAPAGCRAARVQGPGPGHRTPKNRHRSESVTRFRGRWSAPNRSSNGHDLRSLHVIDRCDSTATCCVRSSRLRSSYVARTEGGKFSLQPMRWSASPKPRAPLNHVRARGPLSQRARAASEDPSSITSVHRSRAPYRARTDEA